MFVGSINADLRSIVSEVVRSWESQDIYIGCSGNFTIERILKGRELSLHGNDVSLYTTAIGNYLAGNQMDVAIKNPELNWLEPYMTEGPDRIATLLLCTSMMDGWGRNEVFFQRKRKAYKDQWEQLHAGTVERIHKGIDGLKVEEYWAGDCVDWAVNSPTDAGFISFPPTYTGGYEKLYAALMETFEWEEPEYQMFDDDRLGVMIEAVKEKKEWMMARDVPIPGLEGYEVGKIQTSLRSKPLTIYANKAPRRITMPHQKTEVLKMRRFNEKDVITEDSKIAVKKITQAQMNTLRSLYLNPGIAPAAAGMNLAVLVDGKLIGAIGLSKAQYGNDGGYLMSDFVIRPVKYKRLSKLVLAVVLSKEVKLMLEQSVNQRIRSITTTAFTSKPVSMKYRGLFKVQSKKTNPDRINYEADSAKWTLEGAFTWWKQKHMNQMR